MCAESIRYAVNRPFTGVQPVNNCAPSDAALTQETLLLYNREPQVEGRRACLDDVAQPQENMV